jgi:hypothetical protein
MLKVFNKRLLWVIVVWFAMLQTVLPFIHAHIEADSPAQRHGLHMHDQDLLQYSSVQPIYKSISAPPVHTVGVNEAVVKNVDAMPLPLFALLFFISLPLLVLRLANANLIKHPLPPLHLRSLSRPRAPPLL